MELVTLNDLLSDAKGDYAVPAVNCFNLEMIQAVFEAAEEMRSPIIVQAGSKDIAYSSAETVAAMVMTVGKKKDVRTVIHLDHGHSYEIAVQSIRAGFTSVMFDGSALPFQENIALSFKVAELAHYAGVSCEAELGTIGNTSETGEKIANVSLTDPDRAKEFVDATGIDCLAVGIGNVHGFYPLPPNLDFDRLAAIQKFVSLPLVLHGGTGIPEEQIKQAIKLGISKVNFSTIARSNMVMNMQTHFKNSSDNIRAEDICAAGRKGFKEAVCNAIQLCGSNNKL
jgi:ketose-bisphosphate aldolase